MSVRNAGVALLTGAVLFALPHGVWAQTAEGDSVQERARPDFTPIGIELDEFLGTVGLVSEKTIEQKSSPLSSFTVFPTIGIGTRHDSNIFLTSTDEKADSSIIVSPGISIVSDWANHSLAFSASASIGRHQDYESEDYEDFQIQMSGGLNVDEYTTVSTVVGVAREHEGRDEEDDRGQGFDPTVSYNWFADSTLEYKADALLVRGQLRFEFEDFQDSDGVDNGDQDVNRIDYALRLGYEFTPGTTIFMEPNGDIRKFVRSRDASGLLQDNSAFGTLFGVTFDATGVTFLEIGAGLTHREYDEPSFQSQTSLDFSGKLVWNPSYPFSVTGSAGTSTEESSTVGESGVLTNNYALRLDYEMLDNLIFSSGVAYSVGDNQELSRIDKDYTYDVAVDYFVSEYWGLKFTLAKTERHSTDDNESYDNIVAALSLTGKL